MASLFEIRRDALIRDGFSRQEAVWAAEHKIKLGDPTIQLVRLARRNFIRDHMKFFNRGRRAAIRAASKALTDRNRRNGLVGDNIHNIFREISP